MVQVGWSVPTARLTHLMCWTRFVSNSSVPNLSAEPGERHMPHTISELLGGKPDPLTVTPHRQGDEIALGHMARHDYSQLPVVDAGRSCAASSPTSRSCAPCSGLQLGTLQNLQVSAAMGKGGEAQPRRRPVRRPARDGANGSVLIVIADDRLLGIVMLAMSWSTMRSRGEHAARRCWWKTSSRWCAISSCMLSTTTRRHGSGEARSRDQGIVDSAARYAEEAVQERHRPLPAERRVRRCGSSSPSWRTKA